MGEVPVDLQEESPKSADCSKSDLLKRMVGKSNDTEIFIAGVKTVGLIDSGSQITSVSESFYQSLEPKPTLHDVKELGLSVTSAGGSQLPVKGYIEVDVSLPFISDFVIPVPVLVVNNTDFNSQVPAIIGTNVIKLCKSFSSGSETDIPEQWKLAFDSLVDETIPVKTTNNFSVRIAPGEIKTLSGLVRKHNRNIDTALTEHTDTSLSGDLTICPRVVSLKSSSSTVRVPVRVCNLSARVVEIPPRSLLCSLSSVKVVDSWTPDSAKKQEQKSNTTTVEDLGVKVDSENLTPYQFDQAKEVLSSWSHIFSTGPTDLGRTDIVEHEIKLTDDTPFKEPYRRIPPAMYEEVRQHLREMLDAGAIRPSNSPFSSNVVLVRKKDGSLRFCIDFRKLNSRTVKDAYMLPRIDSTIDTLIGAKYFSKLDLRSGYWQVEMSEKDKEKTAFSVGNLGFYECNRMAFGLTNAPATFQRLMERCMGDLNLKECLIFLDDILIFSESFMEHLERLEAVFSRLDQHGLKLKGSKCEFFKASVNYLGHVVSQEGVKTDPEKIEALASWPEPHNIKTLRSFLGFTGYYRRFIKDYAKIVKPLNDLLVGHSTYYEESANGKRKKKRKVAPWIWEESQRIAFQTLKEKLSSPPVLAYADFSKPFILHTDASLEGLGAVLYQEQDGVERVIAYASRGLRGGERNYPAHKLEFLCLKWAVTDKFHDYLYGNTFNVVTDNNPLTYVLTTAKLDATGHRWLAALGTYDFSLTYRCGKANGDADGLSRRPQQCTEMFPDVVKAICESYTVKRDSCPYFETLVVSNSINVESLDSTTPVSLESTSLQDVDWSKEQLADSNVARIVELVKLGFCPEKSDLKTESPVVLKYLREWKKLTMVDGVLYRNTTLNDEQVRQLVLPLHFRSVVLKHLHDDVGHQGRDRTLSLVRARFYWPGLEKDVEDKVKNCGRCIRRKTPVKPSAEMVNITSTQPMELICIDFLSLERSKGGIENILVITDHFTRYAQAFPTRNQLAKTTAKILFENFVVHYGFPARIHSDQGRNFESNLIKELCSLAGVAKSRTTPYHPMGNGMVERFNQTLLKMLGTLEDHQKQDWKSYVAPLVHAYNATRHDSTGFSPYFLMFGRHPRLAIDAYLGLQSSDDSNASSREHYANKLKRRLSYAYKVASKEAEKNSARHKVNYDLKVREATVDVGDRVLIRKVGLKGKNKLADKWDRHTYIVIGRPDESVPVYRVQRESGDSSVKTLHRNMLLPFSAIPSYSDLGEPSVSVPKQSTSSRPASEPNKQNSELNSESDSSESDLLDVVVVPQKRRRRFKSRFSKSSTPSVSIPHEVSDVSGIPNNLSQSPSRSTFNTREDDMNPEGASRVLDHPSIADTGDSTQTLDLGPPVEQVRRSVRTRKAPQRYGDWQMNQQSVDPEKIVHWV